MRLKRAKMVMEIGLALSGLGLLFIAVFAYQLHIDRNPGLGPNRTLLLLTAVLLILLSLCLISSTFLGRLLRSSRLQGFKGAIGWIGYPFVWLSTPVQEKHEPVGSNQRTGWYALVGAAIAIFISLWYITSGRITT